MTMTTTATATSFPSASGAVLEPVTQQFMDSLAGAPPLYQLSPEAAHAVLTDLQARTVATTPVDIEDTIFPVGPTGETRIRVVRPAGVTERLPVLLYLHGGGWVLGDKVTHDRLVRELADGVRAAVVFVDYLNSPHAHYPVQNEQAYASLLYIVEHADAFNVDSTRIAVAGDSVGGNMAAAVTLMAKARKGPAIRFQVLFYPLLDYLSDNESYRRFGEGPWLIRETMRWMFDLQGLDGTETDITAFPGRASVEQLRGLPDALVITDDDILRDEGQMYASKLSQAGVRVVSVHYSQTIHDFVMLNPLANTPAARAAIDQAVASLRARLHA